MCGFAAQSSQHFVSVHVRHHYVQQDQIGPRIAFGRLQGPRPRIGCPHPVMGLEQFAEDHQVLCRVVDDEYRRERLGLLFAGGEHGGILRRVLWHWHNPRVSKLVSFQSGRLSRG